MTRHTPGLSSIMQHGLAAAALLVSIPGFELTAQTVAITGGTVYPVSGPRIEHGTVLIENGKITAVGTDVSIPSNATRIDATGKWVTPGLIHAWTDLGLAEVSSINATNELRKEGDVDAAFNVAEGINPASVVIPVTRVEGVTSAFTGPAGGLISGQGVMIDLAGKRVEDMVTRSPAAMVIDLTENSKQTGGGSRAGVLQRLRQVLRDALEYERRTDDFRRAQMQPLAAPAQELEALKPVLHGEIPVVVDANRRSDIQSALRLGAEFKLRMILRGAIEGWEVAPDIASARIPVILNPTTDIPTFDALGARQDNAALLRAAGVAVVVAPADDHNYRNLRFAAGNAVRGGLGWDDALRAITLEPARAFGIADRYGSLERGKVANLVVWSGDPFEFATQPEHVLIHGQEISHETRQTELLEKYRKVPLR